MGGYVPLFSSNECLAKYLITEKINYRNERILSIEFHGIRSRSGEIFPKRNVFLSIIPKLDEQ